MFDCSSRSRMDDWMNQYQSSTPKLLPPTVFEKINTNENENKQYEENNLTNSNILEANTDNHTLTVSNSNQTRSLLNASTSSTNDFYYLGDGGKGISNGQQLFLLSNELEKLKSEIRKLHGENEALRHRNRG